jgi:bifunctional enzyme CysN/CysC/sulfate adenylyltransferase subunit 1
VDLLRFFTAGSVDDGKSTLIGRLLLDTRQIFEDQLSAVARASVRRGGGPFDLALLTDGLRAEREQGITIDVAYRYFATPRRKFIVADTPGHVQYTRNMVTGCANSELGLIVVDVERGLTEQSHRHAYIASLMGIRHLVIAVNKMDLVGYRQEPFERIMAQLQSWAEDVEIADLHFIPISALYGDNVVESSDRTDWYDGPTLLEYLESIEVLGVEADAPARMPVQWVLRSPNGRGPGRRAAAGRISSGRFQTGQPVLVLPARTHSRIARIEVFDQELAEAAAPLSVALALADDVDVARGAMITEVESPPVVAREFASHVFWMGDAQLRAGDRVLLKHGTRLVPAGVDEVLSVIDVATLSADEDATRLELNEIGTVRWSTAEPLFLDEYGVARTTGSFIVIDPATNDTVGAGIIMPGDLPLRPR